jgi:hypothetical protein
VRKEYLVVVVVDRLVSWREAGGQGGRTNSWRGGRATGRLGAGRQVVRMGDVES